ncbi:hypothetical protein ACFL0H_13125 [Thermodesulfobacteriota bacterium]
MRYFKVLLIILFAALAVCGCATVDDVLFITKTSVGFELDSKPATASIAYDRIEGYIGPRYENGALPPVVASIQTDGKIFNPQVKQVYATGAAATNLVLGSGQAVKAPTDLSGSKKLMFFGTTTTAGLKVGFTTNVPDSFVFGFKRKEFSLIPLGKRKADLVGNNNSDRVVDVYPSVLASIDTGASTGAPSDTSLVTHQYFATGEAAVELCKDPDLRNLMKNRAKDAFEVYKSALGDQQMEALLVLRCLTKIEDKQLPSVWEDAKRHNLFYDSDKHDKLITALTKAMKETNAEVREQKIRALRNRYADDIGITDGSTPTRAQMLRAHGKFVCDLAKSKK